MKQRGNTLVGLLVTIVLIALLSAVFMYGSGTFSKEHKSPRADGKGTTVPGLVKANAEDTVCRSNLSQVRQSLMIYGSTVDEAKPASLDDLKLPAQVLECPIGHEKYTYDPTSGQVYCPHPGHEKY